MAGFHMGAKLANLLLLLAAMSFNLFVVIAVVVVCGAAKLLSRYLNKGIPISMQSSQPKVNLKDVE